MPMDVGDILRILNRIAPQRLAETWDNAGLQVGQRNWQVRHIRIALDPLPEVVKTACRDKVDMLITHHPLIFRPLSRIDPSTPLCASIAMALRQPMAICAVHTNLDLAQDGLNDRLCAKLGLSAITGLGPPVKQDYGKLSVLAAREDEKLLCHLLKEYAPVLCAPRRIMDEPEDRICAEITGAKADLTIVMRRLGQPQTSMPFRMEWMPLLPVWPSGEGYGRIGELSGKKTLGELSAAVKEQLGAAHVRVAGPLDLPVKTVAVCSGSGGGMISSFLQSAAQVFVSGDIKYHEAREVEAAGRGLIDAGHFASEHIMVEMLTERLKTVLQKMGEAVTVTACQMEADPFQVI